MNRTPLLPARPLKGVQIPPRLAPASLVALLVVGGMTACDQPTGETHSSGPRARSGVAPTATPKFDEDAAQALLPAVVKAPDPETIKGIATPAEIGRLGSLILKALGTNDATAMKSFIVAQDFFTADRTRAALAMGPGGAPLSKAEAALLWTTMMDTSTQATEGLIKDFGGTALVVAEVRVGAVELRGELRLYRGIVVAVRDSTQATTDLRFLGSIVEDTISGDYFVLGFLPIKKDGSLLAAAASSTP